MKILITGIHGFAGSNLVKYLSMDNTIYGLDIVDPKKEGVAKTYNWDDLDAGIVPMVDVIIHLAGMAHDTNNKTVANVYFNVNPELTQKIYDYFQASSADKFVFFSSTKAATDKLKGVLTAN